MNWREVGKEVLVAWYTVIYQDVPGNTEENRGGCWSSFLTAAHYTT